MTLSSLALLFIPICLKLVLDPKNSAKALESIGNNPALPIIGSLGFMLAAFLLILLGQLQFTLAWTSLVSWLGALFGLKSITCLIPSVVEWEVRTFTAKRLPAMGFLGLLFVLGLVYIDLHFLAKTL